MVHETLYEELKRYVRFDAADGAVLAGFRPRVEPHFERIATEFYERIREHAGAHDVLSGEAQIRRLHGSLVQWLRRIFTGPYDEAYCAETATIGEVHVRIGLPQRYMLTAMALIRTALHQVADAVVDERERGRFQSALSRLLDLELAIMLQAYREAELARLSASARTEAEVVAKQLGGMRYLQAVELARVMMVGLDSNGLIRFVNGEVERVTGFSREELLGSSCERLMPQDNAAVGVLIERARESSGAPTCVDVRFVTKAGREREVELTIARGAEGLDDEVTVNLSGRDVTVERAAARRGRQTEKLAAIGTLAAGLAHEIRNPLNGAMLHVTFLERTLGRSPEASPDTKEAVRVVHEEIARLGTLVTEFLDFARPVPLERKETSLRSLCERSAQMVDVPAGVRLELELPSNDITVPLDAPKLHQVLLNLAGNAVDAVAANGGGVVVLRAHRVPHGIVLEVVDDGPGLKEPDAPIFDPFFSTKPGGTGLGLAIAHRIVTDHGGSIEPAREHGLTVFRIRLPIFNEDFEGAAR